MDCIMDVMQMVCTWMIVRDYRCAMIQLVGLRAAAPNKKTKRRERQKASDKPRETSQSKSQTSD